MKKLKLNLDELKVESFETDAKISSNIGTVHGNVSGANPAATCQQCSIEGSCIYYTCGGDTCSPSCEPTECQQTCVGPTCPPGGQTCDLSPSCEWTSACSMCQ